MQLGAGNFTRSKPIEIRVIDIIPPGLHASHQLIVLPEIDKTITTIFQLNSIFNNVVNFNNNKITDSLYTVCKGKMCHVF